MKRIFCLAVSLIIVLGMLAPQTAEASGDAMVVTLAPDTPGNRDVVVNETGIVALKTNFEARENLTIGTVKVRAFSIPVNNGLLAGQATPAKANDVTNVRLRSEGIPLTASKMLEADGSVSFSGTDWRSEFKMTQNTTRLIEVLFDLPSTTTATGLYFVVDGADIQLLLSSGGAVSATGKAQGTYVVVKQQGFLNVAWAGDTPLSAILAVGKTGLLDAPLAKIKFSASLEDIAIQSIPVLITGKGSNFGAISLYDGDIQISVDTAAVNGRAVFSFPPESRWTIRGNKILTIKADITGIGQGSLKGDIINVGVANGIQATGLTSGKTIPANQITVGNGMIESNAMTLADIATPTPQPATAITFWLPGEPKANSDWVVQVGIGWVEHLNAAQYAVEFDPAVLRLDRVEPGRIGNTVFPVSYRNGNAIIQSLPPQNPEATGGDGLLSQLVFRVIGAPKSKTHLRLSNGTLADWQTGGAIRAEWPAVAEIEIGLPGDVNGDGAVNVLDCTKILRIIVGLDPSVPAADLNGDGKVDLADLIRLFVLIGGGEKG